MGLAKKSLGTFIAQVLAQLLQFVIGVMTARLLGAEGKGLVYLLVVLLGISTALGSLGLGEASIYFVGKDRKRLTAAFGNVLIATVIIGIILGTAGWLFLKYGQPNIYVQFPLWIWAVVVLLIPIQLLQSFLMQILSAILLIKLINLIEVTRVLTQLLLFLLFVTLMSLGLEGAFVAYAFSAFFATATFFLAVICYGGRPQRPDWAFSVASLRYGIKAYLSPLLGLLTLRLDAMLVASLATNGIQSTGVYSVATSLAELLIFVPVSIRLGLFPMVSARSTAEANRLTTAACRHTLLLTMILGLGLVAVGGNTIDHIYGHAFAEAVIPLLLLLPGVIMLCQTIIFFGDLNGRGKPGATATSSLAGLIVTVILDFALIPKYGVSGAALASSCAYAIEFFIAGSLFVYNSKLSWRKVFTYERCDFDYYVSLLPELRKSILHLRSCPSESKGREG